MMRIFVQGRRQIKIKCLVCSRVFDNDYRIEHNNKYHPEYRKQNKLAPYEILGAPNKPFEECSSSSLG